MVLEVTSPERLSGRISISGAKNSATRILPASLIFDGSTCIKNFPLTILDAAHKIHLMQEYGAEVERDRNRELVRVDPSTINSFECVRYDYPIRTTYLLVPALLKRFGRARIPYPAGCKIGPRKHDQHLKLWSALGCNVNETPNFIEISAKKLRPFDITFDIFTIGGTENALLSAAIQQQTSIIRNPYISPEVEDLISYLRLAGVEIELSKNGYLLVSGTGSTKDLSYRIIPDRVEAINWIALALLYGRNVVIENIPFEHLEVPLVHLKNIGADITINSDNNSASLSSTEGALYKPFETACGTYPGIISDMQPFFVLLAAGAGGRSTIHDYRYPERTEYLRELSRFCPDVLSWEPGKITVNGPAKFTPASVTATDLRGGMALLIAAIISGGPASIHNITEVYRGYNNLPAKLEKLGVRLTQH